MGFTRLPLQHLIHHLKQKLLHLLCNLLRRGNEGLVIGHGFLSRSAAYLFGHTPMQLTDQTDKLCTSANLFELGSVGFDNV